MAKHDGTAAEIKSRIQASLKPQHLEIINESHLHAGHKEAKKNASAGHFKVIIQCDALADKSRLNQHRAIHQLLEDLLPAKIHALSIEVQN